MLLCPSWVVIPIPQPNFRNPSKKKSETIIRGFSVTGIFGTVRVIMTSNEKYIWFCTYQKNATASLPIIKIENFVDIVSFRSTKCWSRTRTRAPSSPGTLTWCVTTWYSPCSAPRSPSSGSRPPRRPRPPPASKIQYHNMSNILKNWVGLIK